MAWSEKHKKKKGHLASKIIILLSLNLLLIFGFRGIQMQILHDGNPVVVFCPYIYICNLVHSGDGIGSLTKPVFCFLVDNPTSRK